MRILILAWKDLAHPAKGGAEVFTQEVAQGLVARGHELTLFAAHVEGAAAREDVNGVHVVRDGGRLGVYRAARRFWQREGAGSYDVVVDEINTRPFLAPTWVEGTPVVALIYQLAREIWFYETPFPVSVLGRFVLEPRWLRPYRDVPALTISRSSADSLARHHGWTDVTVIPVGLAPLAVPDVPKEQVPTVVFLARMVSMKQPQDALEAFARLREQEPRAQFWAIGEGPLLEKLRRTAPPGASCLGRISQQEVLERLTRAHVLVATSVREGWGLNVSEAAVCGTPSIGYSVAGLVDSLAAAGGKAVTPSPEALGSALEDFFAGRLALVPRVSTVPWAEVAAAVERRLEDVLARA
jgi:glycosyltransferase involved in cell wall biosynthesis